MKTISVKCSNCQIEFQKSISYIKYGEKRGYFNHFCSNKCSCEYNKNKNVNILPKIREEKYLNNPKICPQCKSVIPYKDKLWKIYCSSKCAAIYTQKDDGHCHWSDKDKKRLSKQCKNIVGFYRNNPKTGTNILCPICKNLFYKSKKSKKMCCSKKCSIQWINKTGYLKGKTGGYRERGGRGKQGWYKGYYCNSSWELAWVIYNLDNGLKFKRNTQGFEYEFENRKYKFYPDFILDSGEYVEIKGYMDKKNNSKISNFPYKLNVLQKIEIMPFVEYSIQKYGKNYTQLYEKSS